VALINGSTICCHKWARYGKAQVLRAALRSQQGSDLDGTPGMAAPAVAFHFAKSYIP
jgi:hypothetical protein